MFSKGTAIVVGLVVVVVGAAYAFSAARAQAQLEILENTLAAETSGGPGSTADVVVTVRNNGGKLEDLKFRVANQTKDGAVPVKFTPTTINMDAHSVKQFVLEFTPSNTAQTGYLILEGDGLPAAICPLTIPAADQGISIALLKNVKPDVGWIVGGSLLMACLLVIAVLGRLICKKTRPGTDGKWKLSEIFSSRMMGELEWDFTKNWGATFTLLGAFFVTLGGTALMPKDPKLLSGPAYQLVIVAGPALIALAPMVVDVLNSVGKEMFINLKPEGTELITVGTDKKLPVLILPYIAGSAFVFWAATIEVTTLLVYLRELEMAKAISATIVGNAQWGIIVLWVLGGYYSWERIARAAEGARKRDVIMKEAQDEYNAGQESQKDGPKALEMIRDRFLAWISETVDLSIPWATTIAGKAMAPKIYFP